MSLLLRCADRHYQGMKSRPHRPWQRAGASGLVIGMLVLFSSLGLSTTEARAQDYQFTIVASGLLQPIGISASAFGDSDNLYYTELPQYGVFSRFYGLNTVSGLTLSTATITVLNRGDPAPTNVVQDAKGNLYWTCRSAGVIVMQTPTPDPDYNNATLLVTGLEQPVGIALDAAGQNLYFTELPTPGVGAANGGTNRISQLNLATMTRTVVDAVEPEPTDIVVASNGDLYFTCKSAGVIVHQEAVTLKHTTILAGLRQPIGIALDPKGENLYYTEVPTPGINGANGGQNAVSKFNLQTRTTTLIHFGDPQPTSITITPNGNLYWTCTSAGVIIEAKLGN